MPCCPASKGGYRPAAEETRGLTLLPLSTLSVLLSKQDARRAAPLVSPWCLRTAGEDWAPQGDVCGVVPWLLLAPSCSASLEVKKRGVARHGGGSDGLWRKVVQPLEDVRGQSLLPRNK